MTTPYKIAIAAVAIICLVAIIWRFSPKVDPSIDRTATEATDATHATGDTRSGSTVASAGNSGNHAESRATATSGASGRDTTSNSDNTLSGLSRRPIDLGTTDRPGSGDRYDIGDSGASPGGAAASGGTGGPAGGGTAIDGLGALDGYGQLPSDVRRANRDTGAAGESLDTDAGAAAGSGSSGDSATPGDAGAAAGDNRAGAASSSTGSDDARDRHDSTSADAGARSGSADGGDSRGSSAASTEVPTTYTIQVGDNLSRIAERLYGHPRYWEDIAQANPTVDPLRLREGQVIKLPPSRLAGSAHSDDAGSAASAAHTADHHSDASMPPPGAIGSYTVQAGQTLWDIAAAVYKDGSKWRTIYNANRQQIGDDPDRIRAGLKLVIPPLTEPGK